MYRDTYCTTRFLHDPSSLWSFTSLVALWSSCPTSGFTLKTPQGTFNCWGADLLNTELLLLLCTSEPHHELLCLWSLSFARPLVPVVTAVCSDSSKLLPDHLIPNWTCYKPPALLPPSNVSGLLYRPHLTQSWTHAHSFPCNFIFPSSFPALLRCFVWAI